MATQKELEAQLARTLGATKLYGTASQVAAQDALRDYVSRWECRDVKIACDAVKLSRPATWCAEYTDSILAASILHDANLTDLHSLEADVRRNAIVASIEEAEKAAKAQRLARRNELIDKLTGVWSRRTGEVVDGVEYQKEMRAAWDRNS